MATIFTLWKKAAARIAPAGKMRPGMKRLGLWGASLALCALLILFALRLLAASEAGRNMLEHRLEANPIAGQSIDIAGLKGDLLGHFTLAQLTLRDDEGVWLSAQNVRLAWSPGPLLRRTLRIDHFSAERLDVLRAPLLAPSNGGTSQGQTFALSRLMLGETAIPSLGLGPPLIGTSSPRFSIEASGDLARSKGALALIVMPNDTAGDQLQAELQWSPSTPATGSILADGPPMGLFAELLGLEGDASPKLEAHAIEEEGVWRASGTLAVAAHAAADISAQWSGRTLSGALSVDLSALPRLHPIAHRIGPSLTLQAESPTADRLDITLESEALEAGLVLPFDVDTLMLLPGDGNLHLSTQAPQQLLATEILQADLLTLNGKMNPLPGSFGFDGTLQLTNPHAGLASAAHIEGPLQLHYSGDHNRLDLSGRLAARAAAWQSPLLERMLGPKPALEWDADYHLNEDALTLSHLALRSDASTARMRGQMGTDLAHLDIKGDYHLLQDSEDIKGHWTLERGELGPFKGQLNGTFDGEALSAFVDTGPVLERTITYSGEATYDLSGTLNTSLRASGTRDLAEAALTLTQRGEAISASWSGKIGSVGVGPAAFRALTLSGTANGPAEDIDFRQTLRAEGLTLNGSNLGLSVLSSTGTLSQASAQPHLTTQWNFAAQFMDQPLSVRADLAASSAYWTLASLDARWADLTLKGNATGKGTDPQALMGALQISTQDVDAPFPLRIDGPIRLSGDTLEAQLDLGGWTSGQTALDSGQLSVSGNRSVFKVGLSAEGRSYLGGWQHPIGLTAHTDVDLTANKLQADLTAHMSDVGIETALPLSMDFSGQNIDVSGTLRLLGGTASLNGTMGEALQDWSLEWQGLAMDKLAALTARSDLRGQWRGQANLLQKDVEVVGQLHSTLSDIASETGPTPPGQLTLNAELTPSSLTGTLVANGGDELDLAGAFSVPVTHQAGIGDLRLDTRRSLRADLSGTGDLAILSALTGLTQTRLGGRFFVAFQAEGPPNSVQAIQPNGHLTLRDGEIEDGEIGLLLKDIALTADLSPDAITVNTLSANGARRGTLMGSGRYGFAGQSSVDLVLDQLDALQRDDISARVSGPLTLIATSDGASLTGDLTIDRARIDTEKLPQGGYTTLEVTFKDAPKELAPKPRRTLPIALDIALQGRRNIEVIGPGLNTDWAADLQVGGTLAVPSLQGRLSLLRGDIDLVGRNFQFAPGEIQFDGDPATARLNLRAERDTQNLTARIDVSGRIAAPQITFSSEPALPEDEVISQLLFSRSPTQLTALEAAQLGAAIATLSGGSAFDFMGQIENALRLDRVDLGVSDSGEATLSTGKFVGDNLYVELRSNARGAQGVGVEWTPRRNLEIGADIDVENNQTLRLNWRRDFNLRRSKPAGAPDEPEADGDTSPRENVDELP